jgi:hypothetical protein
MVAKKMKWDLNIDRSTKDKRLRSMVSSFMQESAIILGLPFEDSDRTGPFCNHFSFLEYKKVQKKTLQDHLDGGYTLRATDKTPWTQNEADVMDQVGRLYLLERLVCVGKERKGDGQEESWKERNLMTLCSVCLTTRRMRSAWSSSRAWQPGLQMRTYSGP